MSRTARGATRTRGLSDTEVRQLSDYVEQLRTEDLRRGKPGPGYRGRPTLTKGAVAHSPSIHVRVPEGLYRRLNERADSSGTSMSEIVRDILQKHVPRAS